MAKEAKKVFFTNHLDILLLRQVLADSPFLAKHGETLKSFEKVKDALKFTEIGDILTAKTCYDRFYLLLNTFQSEDSKNAKKSGVEEEYDEKQQLLTDISVLIKEHNKEMAKEKQKLKQEFAKEKQKFKEDEEAIAKEIREDAMKTLKEKKLNTPKKRNLKGDLLENSKRDFMENIAGT